MGIKAALGASLFLLASSHFVNAQGPYDPLAFAICRKIIPGDARLKCFDAIGQQQKEGEQREAPTQKWEMNTSASPVDDSPQVVATLGGTNGSLLVLRCKERQTEVAVSPGVGFFTSSRNAVPALIRINDQPPIQENWSPAQNNSAAFARNPIDFIRLLPDNGKLFVRLTGYEGQLGDASFQLGDVSTVRSKIEETCKWSTPKAAKLPQKSQGSPKP